MNITTRFHMHNSHTLVTIYAIVAFLYVMPIHLLVSHRLSRPFTRLQEIPSLDLSLYDFRKAFLGTQFVYDPLA